MMKGNSVIISPYAKSVAKIPMNIWERIIEYYKLRNYNIYTNVVADELPLENTEKVTIPLNEMK